MVAVGAAGAANSRASAGEVYVLRGRPDWPALIDLRSYTPDLLVYGPAEFAGMNIEGSVKLGYRKELEAVEDPAKREQLFEELVAGMYEVGKASEAASYLEIDAVIDPADTRAVILRALAAAGIP